MHLPSPRKRPFKLGAIALSMLLAFTAYAADPKVKLDLPAEALDKSINHLAQQTGVQIIFASSLTTGKHAPALKGEYSAREALQKLLQGSGLEVTSQGDNTFTLRAQASSQNNVLEEVHVLGKLDTREQNLAFDGRNSYSAKRSFTGTKSSTSLLETPRSINVVTRAQMDDLGVQTITEALRYTPGVVLQYANTDSRYDWMTVRGFSPPTRYLDGLRLPFGANGYSQAKIDPYLLERVEILKGPASSLYGQSSPGGMLALSSKLPTDYKRGEVQLQTGSHGRKQGAFDISGPVDDEGRVLYRLVGLAREADTQTRYVEDDKVVISPSLTFKPDNNTSLTLLAHYQKIDSRGGAATALPAKGTLYSYGNLGRLPTDTFIGEKHYDRYVNEQWFAGYMFSHAFNEQWTFRQNLRYGRVDADSRRVQGACLATDACLPTNLVRYAWAFPEDSNMFTIDNQIEGQFSTGPLQHRILLGVDYTHESATYRESNLNYINLYNYNAFASNPFLTTLVEPPLGTKIDSSQRQLGFYAQDQIKWDNWTLQLGARHDQASKTNETLTASTWATRRITNSDDALTGNIGLSYTFAQQLTPYIAFASSFQPSTGVDGTGSPFDATKGRQSEAGVKYQPLGMDASLGFSVYHLAQRNVITTAPNGSRVQTGEVEVKGAELEGKAKLGYGFEALASYAYTDSEITKTGIAAQLGNQLAFVPRHQASTWLHHVSSAGLLDGLGIGLGVRYLGSSYGENLNAFRNDDVTLLDAALHYNLAKANPSLKGFSLQVNAANLADKKYVATCISNAGCYYGDRRSIYATVKYQW